MGGGDCVDKRLYQNYHLAELRLFVGGQIISLGNCQTRYGVPLPVHLHVLVEKKHAKKKKSI